MEKGIIARDPNPPNRDPTRRNDMSNNAGSMTRVLGETALSPPLTKHDNLSRHKPLRTRCHVLMTNLVHAFQLLPVL
jgi:hypothetical protein